MNTVSATLFCRVLGWLGRRYGDRDATPQQINELIDRLGGVEELYQQLPLTKTTESQQEQCHDGTDEVQGSPLPNG